MPRFKHCGGSRGSIDGYGSKQLLGSAMHISLPVWVTDPLSRTVICGQNVKGGVPRLVSIGEAGTSALRWNSG